MCYADIWLEKMNDQYAFSFYEQPTSCSDDYQKDNSSLLAASYKTNEEACQCSWHGTCIRAPLSYSDYKQIIKQVGRCFHVLFSLSVRMWKKTIFLCFTNFLHQSALLQYNARVCLLSNSKSGTSEILKSNGEKCSAQNHVRCHLSYHSKWS